MSSGIQLIVGLANPGKAYAETRHNAGAWFVDEVAHLAKTTLRPEAKYHGLFAMATWDTQSFQLLIPTTFMNHSGKAVQSLMSYYKIPPQAVLIAHDDIDLPVGTVKLKFDGGDGGHNGLKDVIHHLHTKQFYRLRIGVGRPRNDTIDYVLEPPSKSDRQKIDASIQEAITILPLLFAGEAQKAMQQLHTETPKCP